MEFDPDQVHLILEYCRNVSRGYNLQNVQGDLFKTLKLSESRRLSELEAFKYFIQLVSGLIYLHSIGFCHRDLKLENLLLDDSYNLKIADFGWVARINGYKRNFNFCGTLDYLAPEMIKGNGHDWRSDIWATGVLLYEMLVGKPPFLSTRHYELVDRILACKIHQTGVNQTPCRIIKADALDAVKHFLRPNPEDRIGLHDIFQLKWVQRMLREIHTIFLKFDLQIPDTSRHRRMTRRHAPSLSGKYKDNSAEDAKAKRKSYELDTRENHFARSKSLSLVPNRSRRTPLLLDAKTRRSSQTISSSSSSVCAIYPVSPPRIRAGAASNGHRFLNMYRRYISPANSQMDLDTVSVNPVESVRKFPPKIGDGISEPLSKSSSSFDNKTFNDNASSEVPLHGTSPGYLNTPLNRSISPVGPLVDITVLPPLPLGSSSFSTSQSVGYSRISDYTISTTKIFSTQIPPAKEQLSTRLMPANFTKMGAKFTKMPSKFTKMGAKFHEMPAKFNKMRPSYYSATMKLVHSASIMNSTSSASQNESHVFGSRSNESRKPIYYRNDEFPGKKVLPSVASRSAVQSSLDVYSHLCNELVAKQPQQIPAGPFRHPSPSRCLPSFGSSPVMSRNSVPKRSVMDWNKRPFDRSRPHYGGTVSHIAYRGMWSPMNPRRYRSNSHHEDDIAMIYRPIINETYQLYQKLVQSPLTDAMNLQAKGFLAGGKWITTDLARVSTDGEHS